MKILLPLAWTAWSLTILGLLYGLLRAATDRTHSPEAARGLGVAVLLILLALAAAVTLAARLPAGKVPAGADRDGSTLLIYALRRFRFDNGNFDCVRVLLQAGADPNAIDPHSGWPPLLDLGGHPNAVRAFVQAGANIEALADGVPAVVRFTGGRNWESAQFLVEHGARLDTSTPEGLSLDYYLNTWRDSVFGDHPEGWDRLRAAIAKRRSN